MAKIQAVWALDIGQAALKALKLVPGDTPDEVLAEAFDYVEYPKILSQPDADPEALVGEALATFLDRNDLKGSRVAIAVPGQAGLVKFIKLPPVEKKRIPDIVKFEAKQQIPFALEEVVWAYQQIGGDGDGEADEEFTMAEVGLFAMKRDQISRAIAPFKAAGIEIDVVQMGPIALYNYITFDQLRGSGLKGSIVLLDIGADNTDLIISDGTRIWQRNVPIGGNHFTRALTKELKLTFAKAEHLKRNATKAPDPKAVFTAMRGIFNDFASEVNRSIGFYSSVNRQAQILKVIGLGNGFKLPGLQKFLQQNLNGLDVEKLDGFSRLAGDEVKAAPQFVENLASFAVSYGLGLQGLGQSQLRTNLLPPEVEQVRLIRRKKPWALVASAMLMLGFTALYAGAFKAYAKVVNPEFKAAADRAKGVSSRGASFASDFNAAKGEFEGELAKGKALVVSDDQRARWPKFLQTINAHMPDPAAQYKLDPRVPKDVMKLDKLRVHIDKIKPVYRADVAEWHTGLKDSYKATLHPLDRKEPPSGEGWIIQLLCHHYNPTPGPEQTKVQRNLSRDKWTELGPYNYIYERVLPGLRRAELRQQGVHHVALAGYHRDKDWTPEKGASGGALAGVGNLVLLPRAKPPVATGDPSMGGGYDSGMGGMMGPGMEGGMMGGMMGPGMMGGGYDSGMGGMMGPGMMGPNAAKKSQIKTQTRTDFLIQFVWQPPTADKPAKTIEEIVKELQAAENDEKNRGAIAASTESVESRLEQDSKKSTDEAIAKAASALKAAAKAAPAPGGANGATPPPGAEAAPAPAPAPGPAPNPATPNP